MNKAEMEATELVLTQDDIMDFEDDPVWMYLCEEASVKVMQLQAIADSQANADITNCCVKTILGIKHMKQVFEDLKMQVESAEEVRRELNKKRNKQSVDPLIAALKRTQGV